MVDVAHRVRALAPDAYVINFTNPAGMITEAMQSVLGDRVLGICDTPSGLGMRVAAAFGLEPARLQLDYVGLNHLGWMRRILHDGVDLLPRLLADDALLGSLEEGVVFGREWLRDLGVIPNEYLYYYYFNREAVRATLDAPQTRGEFLGYDNTNGFVQATYTSTDVSTATVTDVVNQTASVTLSGTANAYALRINDGRALGHSHIGPDFGICDDRVRGYAGAFAKCRFS